MLAAAARYPTPPALLAVHAGRDRLWQLEDAHGRARIPYHWLADRHTTPPPERRAIAAEWWHWAETEAHRVVHRSSYPAWFYSWAACISAHEEYGESGPNTTAGYFGMVYPVASYPSPAPQIAAADGYSWLDVPLSDQLRIVWALYQLDGSSPWSTRIYCG